MEIFKTQLDTALNVVELFLPEQWDLARWSPEAPPSCSSLQMAIFNYLHQTFFHRSLRREEFNLTLFSRLLCGTDTGNGESSSAGRWWSWGDEDVFFCLSNWLLSRRTGLVQTTSSTRHKKWEIWRVPAVLPALPVDLHSVFQWLQLLTSTSPLCIWSGLTSQLPKSSCSRHTQPARLLVLPLTAICASSSGGWGWSTSQGIYLGLTRLQSYWQPRREGKCPFSLDYPSRALKKKLIQK